MASTVLPQALITIPRNPSRCSLKMIGFSMAVSRRSLAASSSLSVGRVSPSSVWSVSSLSFARRGFVVRAEAGSEGDVIDSAEEIVDVGGEVVVAEAEEPPKTPWKPRVKLGDVMGILNKRAVEASESERPIPDIRTGDVVMIKLEVPENKRRLSIYKGIVISRQNAGIHTTIRVRRIIAGVGVEIVFPLYSPNIKEIRVVSHRKVRRARLYYLRDKLPRLSTFK